MYIVITIEFRGTFAVEISLLNQLYSIIHFICILVCILLIILKNSKNAYSV